TERIAAAKALGQLRGARYDAWKALCKVFQDGREDAEVRRATVRAIGVSNPAAAPNQLCRYIQGDPGRRVRAEAVAMLARLGRVPLQMEPQLQRDLNAIRQGSTLTPLVNLAMAYGRDPRVLTTLSDALHNAEPEIRTIAQGGLGMLGELEPVVGALLDPSSQVRAGSATTLGRYGLRTEMATHA